MRGLALPVRPDENGRAVMVTDEDEQLSKVIMVALSDCTSNNAFQALGLPPDHIFDLNDSTTSGKVREIIERLFRRLEREGRARLISVTSDPTLNDQGEAVLFVTYTDIKTRSIRETSLGVGRSGKMRILED